MLQLPDQIDKFDTVDVSKEVEITIRVKNKPSVLARLFATSASAGTRILACSSYSNGKWAIVLLVAENPARVERALEEGGFEYGTDSIVLVGAPEKQVCNVQLTAQLRAAGIGVLYSYTSWLGEQYACVVFKTQDDERAVRIFRGYLTGSASRCAEEVGSTKPSDGEWNGFAV